MQQREHLDMHIAHIPSGAWVLILIFLAYSAIHTFIYLKCFSTTECTVYTELSQTYTHTHIRARTQHRMTKRKKRWWLFVDSSFLWMAIMMTPAWWWLRTLVSICNGIAHQKRLHITKSTALKISFCFCFCFAFER